MIKIHNEDNVCSTCEKPFKYKIRYWGQERPNDPTAELLPKGLKLVEMVTACVSCRSLFAKIKQKEQELDNLNFELFCRTEGNKMFYRHTINACDIE